MKIIVLLKPVPDTYGERTLSLETGLADRAEGDLVLDEIGERALEAALSYADGNDGVEVAVLCVGPTAGQPALRKGLAMGAASATHILDDALTGADVRLTSEVIAAAVRRIGFDVIICGNQSTDGVGGVVPAMVAEMLDLPSLTYLNTVELRQDEVSGTRASGTHTTRLTAALPAVVSITEALPEARFPTFKGIMAAKKKPYDTWNLDALGIDADDFTVSHSILVSVAERPARSAGIKVVDDGESGRQLADYLLQNRLV